MNVEVTNRWSKCAVVGAMLMAGMECTLPGAYAGGRIEVDDDKWISVGIGIKSSFNSIEGAAGGHYSNDFKVDFQRLYINGSIHKYVQFTFNTECFNCNVGGGANHFGGNANIGLLDAIGRFEINERVNLWVGRTLVPSERGELNGPFFHATYDGFRTPFNPADFSGNFPSGPNGAGPAAGQGGLYGRSDGAVFYGKVHPFGTHLMYVASVFTGVRGGPNNTGSLLYAGRLQWNLLNDEDNPGYYTSGTYYGTAGDIIAISGNVIHQKDGAGDITTGNVSDYTGAIVDLLVEKVLPNNMGVFTFNGEFKRYWANYGVGAFTNPAGCAFCIFNGHSWTVYGLYLLPQEIGIGRFQPYIRFTSIDPLYSATRQEWEYGVNYIISGHNARISAYGRYGDLESKGGPAGPFSPSVTGNKIDSFHVALQLQF